MRKVYFLSEIDFVTIRKEKDDDLRGTCVQAACDRA